MASTMTSFVDDSMDDDTDDAMVDRMDLSMEHAVMASNYTYMA